MTYQFIALSSLLFTQLIFIDFSVLYQRPGYSNEQGPRLMELIQIEKTSDIFIIVRGDSGPRWVGTALLE